MPSSLARRLALLFFVAFAAPLRAEPAAKPVLIPATALAADPLLRGPKLSPDGKRVLGTMVMGERAVPGVLDLATGQVQPYNIPDKTDLRWARWAGNDRFLVSLQAQVNLGDSKVSASRLVAITVGKPSAVFLGMIGQGRVGDDLLFVDPQGAYVLLSMQASIFDYPAVYRFDLVTGKSVKVQGQKPDIVDWHADSAGVVRAGLAYQGSLLKIYYRPDATHDFARVESVKLGIDKETDRLLDQLQLTPGSDDGFVLTSKQDGRIALYRFNYATRSIGEQIFAAPANDVTGYDLSEDNKSVEAVYYTDDRNRVVWFDPKLKEHQAAIDKVTAGRQASIVSRSKDGTRMIVHLGASTTPGAYYVFDVNAGVMQRIVAFAPDVKRDTLSEMQAVEYTARDGTLIHAYLTLPKGREAKGLPLIILPHGGPYGVRDTLGFDPEVQFLANRGYAVLQPNFRGSGGYGKAFYERGEGQFGRAMQDDLDDGMDWLVKRGTVDAKRVCLVGTSYGGYAALWGATRNPERYRCAASFAGISDVRRILSYSSDFFYNRRYRADWRRVMRGEESFDLASISPLQQIARLRVPVLVVHGDDDKVVPVRQSTLYTEALQAAGKPFETHIYKDEKHGPNTATNRADWMTRLEAFLAKHNPA